MLVVAYWSLLLFYWLPHQSAVATSRRFATTWVAGLVPSLLLLPGSSIWVLLRSPVLALLRSPVFYHCLGHWSTAAQVAGLLLLLLLGPPIWLSICCCYCLGHRSAAAGARWVLLGSIDLLLLVVVGWLDHRVLLFELADLLLPVVVRWLCLAMRKGERERDDACLPFGGT